MKNVIVVKYDAKELVEVRNFNLQETKEFLKGLKTYFDRIKDLNEEVLLTPISLDISKFDLDQGKQGN